MQTMTATPTCTTRLGWKVGEPLGRLIDCDKPRGHLPPHSGIWEPELLPDLLPVRVTWSDLDQRSFHGDWQRCVHQGCPLPLGHLGGHAATTGLHRLATVGGTTRNLISP